MIKASTEDRLRQMVLTSGRSVHSIAKASGISQPLLHRFVHGGGILFNTADKLMSYFDLVLVPRDRLPADSQ